MDMLGTIGVKEHSMKMDWKSMICAFDLILILSKKYEKQDFPSILKIGNKMAYFKILIIE